MYGVLHPFGKALYDQEHEGIVRVTQTDGQTGRFPVMARGSTARSPMSTRNCAVGSAGPRAQHRLQTEPKVS